MVNCNILLLRRYTNLIKDICLWENTEYISKMGYKFDQALTVYYILNDSKVKFNS